MSELNLQTEKLATIMLNTQQTDNFYTEEAKEWRLSKSTISWYPVLGYFLEWVRGAQMTHLRLIFLKASSID